MSIVPSNDPEAVLYLAIDNPKHTAMLSSYTWDACGFVLTLGFIPLLIVNFMAFKYFRLSKIVLNGLFFIPSIICFLCVLHYLIFMTNWSDEEIKEPIARMKCALDSKVYYYSIYLDNDEYSLGMDDKDKLPLSEIDYTSKDSILESIEKYYKNNGGMCP